jgi:hypothetical protein
MLTCFAVRHQADDLFLQSAEHNLLEAIAEEATIKFEPGFAGNSYLEVPVDENAKQAVVARLEQNRMRFSVVTRIAY